MSDPTGEPKAAAAPVGADNDQAADTASGPGLYGKVSTKGDFVTRRLARGFVEPWDAWLQAAIAHSRESLGEAWLPTYLNAPIWRFVLSAGVCGEQVMAGILMPSIDKVGRHFPLTLTAAADPDANPAQVFTGNLAWFGELEALALSTLEDGFDFAAFDSALAALGAPADAEGVAMALGPPRPLEGGRWRFAIDPACELGPGDPLVVHQILRATMPRYCLWWSAGSQQVAPSFLVCDALPDGDGFLALLDGEWGRGAWSGARPGAMPWADDDT